MPYGSLAARENALRGNIGDLPAHNATLYVALLRATVGQEGTTLGVEPDSTGNYARLAVANADASWTFGSPNVTNAIEWRWPAATAQYSITDPLNQWALYDNSALGAGTLIAFGELTTTIDVTGANDVPVIPVGGAVLIQAV